MGQKKKSTFRKKPKQATWSSSYTPEGEDSKWELERNPDIHATKESRKNRAVVSTILASVPISLFALIFSCSALRSTSPTEGLESVVEESIKAIWEPNDYYSAVAQSAAEEWVEEQGENWKVLQEIKVVEGRLNRSAYEQEHTFTLEELHKDNSSTIWNLTLGITRSGGAIKAQPLSRNNVVETYQDVGLADICPTVDAVPSERIGIIDEFINAYVEGNYGELRQLAKGNRADGEIEWPIYWQAGLVNLETWNVGDTQRKYRIDCYQPGFTGRDGSNVALIRVTIRVSPAEIIESRGDDGIPLSQAEIENAIKDVETIEFRLEENLSGVISVYGATPPGEFGINKEQG